MKKIFQLLSILLLINCSTPSPAFEIEECYLTDSIPNDNIRNIFKPCRQYIYTAKYWDREYNLISDEEIHMMATGKAWEHQPDLQDEIIIQYAYDSSQIDFINEFSINPEFQYWTRKTTTGIIENGAQTWMHPFRQNQYSFTEVAPFPSVRLPLEQGKTWSSNLSIYDGWGVWSNAELTTTYTVVKYETVRTGFGQVEAWYISSFANAEFGTSTHDFWYNDEFGFIKMFIKNYEGQLLQFELTEVIEPL